MPDQASFFLSGRFLGGCFLGDSFFSRGLGGHFLGRRIGGGFLDDLFLDGSRRVGGFLGGGQLRGALLGALDSLLAGLALVRVAADGALTDAGGVEEAGDAIGRLGADRQPMPRALGIDLDAVRIILGEQRVVRTDLLDEGAVARRPRIGDDDAIIGALLGAAPGETDGNGHRILPF